MEHKTYVLETRRHFSDIIRAVFGDEPKSFIISDQSEINTILMEISRKINLEVNKMSYIWWWRGGNNHLNKFEVNNNHLYLNNWKLRISELYINISPISIFDFIILRVKGEDNDVPDTQNYEWNNNFTDLNLDKHTLYDFSIRKQLNDDLDYFSQPYNFILTAQFGLPNLDIYPDSLIEKMLNKLLFGEITNEGFQNWYTNVLANLKGEVNRFYNHIVKYPMLALEDKLGKQIYDSLKDLDRYELTDQIFFRARPLIENIPYDEEGMWNPPAYKLAVYEGRYNHFGQSFLYMAADEETAFKEVIPEWHRSCSMIKIKVQETISVLDLRKVNFYSENSSIKYIILHYMLVHEGTISQETKNSYIKPEYVVPRFVADCARLHNFEGILFNSTKNNGDNLVLFKPDMLKERGNVITVDEPYIFTVS
ncbi:RES domain-containing protein [Vibrio vulnificus]|nr:RES domain-containing protein [Vibrio vulnificus]